MTLELKHPTDLNPWQIYRQAKKLAKHTSRAKNADWYKGAFELDRQWHLWIDGETTVSAVYDRGEEKWFAGPELPEFANDPASAASGKLEPAESVDQLHSTLSNLIAGREIGGKSNSIGVVLHLADDFTLADIAPEYTVDEDFDAVNELLTLDPQTALGDSDADSLAVSWRALPYWGIHDGERRSTAVQVSKSHQTLIDELRSWGENKNIPVIASAVSAPLEAIRLASVYIDWAPGKGDIILLQYRTFSAFAALGTSGELMLVRALPHVGERRHPSRLGETLVTTAASMNLSNPRVHIVPMQEGGTDGLIKDLGTFFSNRPAMDIGVIDIEEIDTIPDIPGGRMEMLLAQSDLLAAVEAGSGLMDSLTFQQLSESWATQDFYGLSTFEKQVYPERKDLKILKVASKVKLLLAILTIGLMAWTGLGYFRTALTDAWRLDEAEASAAKVRMQDIKKQNDEAVYWENVMSPRGEGWLVLEAMLQLFPAESGVIVTECDYKVVGMPAAKDSKKVGFESVWTLKGYARQEGAARLSRLSSSRFLNEQFSELAEAFDSEGLRPNPDTRALDATMQQRQGQLPASAGLPASVARHYRNAFELSIRQVYNDDDTLALTAKPPF